uniref:Beta-defensin n=1 Tax=Monodelphis domestica TaxID=13616 RepID=F7G3C6_MONDO
MGTLPILFAVFFFLAQDDPVRSGLEEKLCGHSTASCRKRCLLDEKEIGKCLNMAPCCLKSFKFHPLSFLLNKYKRYVCCWWSLLSTKGLIP